MRFISVLGLKPEIDTKHEKLVKNILKYTLRDKGSASYDGLIFQLLNAFKMVCNM